MASPANFIHHLVNLLIVVALIEVLILHDACSNTHKFVSADDKFMKVECHSTEVPELCMECLKSDPRAPEADELGVATILTNCLTNHTILLAANMSAIVLGAPGEKLKSACESCSQGYSQARKDLSKVLSYLKSGDYDKAGHSVLTALKYQLMCQESIDQIESEQWDLPESITYEMKVYEDLSEASMRIIDRL